MNPSGDHFVFCECGADNHSDAARCWMCQRDLPGARRSEPALPNSQTPEAAAGTTAVQQPANRSLPGTVAPEKVAGTHPEAATLALWATLFIVGLGVFLVAPGLAILLAIVAMPALVRTALVVGHQSNHGKQVPAHRKISLFLGSLATSVIVLIVVLVAAVGSFCAVCLGAGSEKAVPLAALVAISITGVVVSFLWKWLRSRWRRDIQ